MLVGILLALTTSVSWALGNVFIQKSGRAVGPPRAMFWALLAGAVLAALFALALDVRTAPFDRAAAGWAVVAGGSGLLAYICLFYALERAPLSLAVPLISSWSLVSAALSLLVLGEELRRTQVIGAAVVFLGVVLVSIGSSHGAPPSAVRAAGRVRSLWAAGGSAVGFGVMVPALGRVAPAAGEFGASALVYGIGLALAVPLVLFFRVDVRPPPPRTWGLVLFTGCLETIGFVAVAFARRFAPMAVITPVASLAAALTVLYAWVILRERPPRMAALGAGCASVGVVILTLEM